MPQYFMRARSVWHDGKNAQTRKAKKAMAENAEFQKKNFRTFRLSALKNFEWVCNRVSGDAET